MRLGSHGWLGLAGVAVGVVVAGGCLPQTSHQCETSAQCGPAGTCEASGACSFPATDCPGGRRYGEGAGPLAGQCVEDDRADGGGDVDAAAGLDGPDRDAPQAIPWGDRHHGDLDVGVATARINSYGVLADDAGAGATMVLVTRTSGANVGSWNDNFVDGDRVMFWRTTGLADPVMSGSTVPTVLSGEVGRWFVTRVVTSSGGANARLTLADPLPVAFPALGTQVVKVPELDTVTIGSGRTVIAESWGGAWGGIVAFHAESLLLSGAIEADGAGFRGGIADNFGDFVDCSALDGRSPGGGGAAKGESLVPMRYGNAGPQAGRGNIHSGGGGGDCRNAGGGGGGGAGAGGNGGDDRTVRPVGGMPGVALSYGPATHLAPGGGGGAGEDNDSNAGNGAPGGGVVLVIARTVVCSGGAIAARGADAPSLSVTDGAGGGGGGGVVWIRAETIQGCAVAADGGAGGSAPAPQGGGGGGGGGRVVVEAATSTGVAVTIGGGAAGAGGSGSSAGMPGVVE